MKEKKYLIIGIISTLILMIGFSLAYFTPQIIGEGKKMTVNTANLEIIFTDTSEVITEEEILPGWSTSKSFTVENKSNSTFYFDITMKEYINTFVLDYLEYKITSTNGYNMTEYKPLPKSNEKVIAYLKEGISIEEGETHTYTIEYRYRDVEENQAEDMNKIFEGILSIIEGRKETFEEGTLASQLLKYNPDILGRINFDNVYEEENIGTLYKASGSETEDGSDVYYFAGNAQNNWVKFGKDQDNADLYWRIIRTNEDGGVRLLYIGPDKATESAFIKIDGEYMSGGSKNIARYNLVSNNTMYVGYMYGEEGSLESNRQNTTSSQIKIVTDLWYSKTINVKTDMQGNIYNSYVSKTAIYCNDRSSGQYASSGTMNYAGRDRLYRNNTPGRKPTYRCGYNAGGGYTNTSGTWVNQSEGMSSNADIADKFSVSKAKGGNGQLEYPIAQITADEIVYAGGKISKAAPVWYSSNSTGGSAVGNRTWWTMSPYDFNGSSAYVFAVSGGSLRGKLKSDLASFIPSGIRPVISLKSCVKYVNGDGSSDSPYEVSIDNICASLEN